MARGINKVILIGNLGDEPLCRTTHSGVSVTNISMVTNEVRRNLETGENTEYPEWHRVVMWGRLADIAKQYLHKGSQIYIEGKLRTRSYMDKQGQKRSITEVVADEMQMLGPKVSSNPSPNWPDNNDYAPYSDPAYGNPSGNFGGSAGQAGGYNNGYTRGRDYGTNSFGGPRSRQQGPYGNPGTYNQNTYGQGGGSQRYTPYGAQPETQLGGAAPLDNNDGTQNAAAGSPIAAAPSPAPIQGKAPDESGKELQEPALKMEDDEIPF